MHCTNTLICVTFALLTLLSHSNARREKNVPFPNAKNIERENRLVSKRLERVLRVLPICDSQAQGAQTGGNNEGGADPEPEQEPPQLCNTIVSRTYAFSATLQAKT